MVLSRSVRRAAQALAASSLVLAAAAVPAHAARPTVARQAVRPAAAVRPLTLPETGTPSFTRNFSPFATGAIGDAIRGVIYEPLYIVVVVAHGKQYPWLATSYAYSKDLKTLTFTIRQGVKWSDGQAMTVKDVVYTLTAGQSNPALDQVGLWGPSGLATSVTSSGNTVSIHFKQANVAGFPALVNNLYILPQHIWSTIKNPVTYTNPDPVGTGPFTQLQNFSAQSFELGKNPYYWQPGKPSVAAIRFQAFAGNDSASLALESGQLDWSGNFVPNVKRSYDARNPNFHSYYPPLAGPGMIYLNNTKYPYSLPVFRKALSMSINRQAANIVAEYGNFPPSNATGLANVTGTSGLFPTWQDKSIPNTVVQYNPNAAKAMLMKAGFTMQGGALLDPKGHPVSFSIPTPSAFSDLVAADNVLVQGFKSLGIDASVKLVPNFGDWYTNVYNGYDVVSLWTLPGTTPYDLYHNMLGSDNYKPIGTAALGNNWERYKNPALDALFARFRQTTDAAQQHALVDQMQRIFVADLPAIPMLQGALFEQYNTTYYTGFPSPDNYYANGQPAVAPDRLLVYTTVKPTH